jgi:hypothetical protein
VGARSRELAAALRATLGTETESILHELLDPPPGIQLTIRDLDLGHRLCEADRITLVSLVRAVCANAEAGRLQLSLLPDGSPGMAFAVLSGDGLPSPAVAGDGRLVAESTTRWWYDLPLRCDARPTGATNAASPTTTPA